MAGSHSEHALLLSDGVAKGHCVFNELCHFSRAMTVEIPNAFV